MPCETNSPQDTEILCGVQRGQSYLMRRCVSLALVGHPSSDGVTIKMPYGVDVLHQPALHPISWEMNAGGSCD